MATKRARRSRRARPVRRPDPEPLEVDDSLVIAVGTVLWAIAWIVMLVYYGELADHGNEWYPWTAAAGLGLGLWGWFLVRNRIRERPDRAKKERGRRARNEPPAQAPESPSPGRRRRAAR